MIANDTLPLDSAEPARPERAAWPRAVMATLLVMIASLTIHLVDITWFDGDSADAAAEAAAPYHVASQR